ncbi:sigma-70 family RNA polymerase sigma factor [Neobacillus vireti]|uniref:sigma-70 family RNA polymerase sigma factor n=1 Tax=Neobacillus vireti TaxID=220686 RepID=UPI002FFFDAD2
MSNKLSIYNTEDVQQETETEESIWLEYYPKLHQYCHFLTQNKWDADDIAQEVYLKAKKYYSNKQTFTSALLNKIAYHHWIDQVRKRKKETIELDDEIVNQKEENQAIDIMYSVELLMKHFTPKQAITFMLKEAFQYQSKEIAEILRTTEEAVKSNLYRAKKRLKKVKEDEKSFPIDLFWDEEERELLASLFYQAIKIQNPSILIQSIPLLKSVGDIPQIVTREIRSVNRHTPSSTLCMAA